MSILEMIARDMMAQSVSSRRASPSLTHDQEIERLKDNFTKVYEAAEPYFAPGAIIWVKNPEGVYIDNPRQPHQFIDYLEDPVDCSKIGEGIKDLFRPQAAAVLNCRIAYVGSCGRIHLALADSRMFTATRPVKAEEPVVDPANEPANEQDAPDPAPEPEPDGDEPTAA